MDVSKITVKISPTSSMTVNIADSIPPSPIEIFVEGKTEVLLKRIPEGDDHPNAAEAGMNNDSRNALNSEDAGVTRHFLPSMNQDETNNGNHDEINHGNLDEVAEVAEVNGHNLPINHGEMNNGNHDGINHGNLAEVAEVAGHNLPLINHDGVLNHGNGDEVIEMAGDDLPPNPINNNDDVGIIDIPKPIHAILAQFDAVAAGQAVPDRMEWVSSPENELKRKLPRNCPFPDKKFQKS